MNTVSLNALQKLTHYTLHSPLGQSSDSIRLGFERGFDSGEMMDRIYQNRPSGKNRLGRLADAVYLNQIGCRGLRGRKALLKATLRQWIDRQRQDGRRPVILDIASGPATYLVETLAEIKADDVLAIGRDLDEHGLQRGEELAAIHSVKAIRFERGNALDEGGLRAIQPRPTLIISSGFYEILLDDDLVRASMRIVRRALPAHGVFIFTTQVNHPQVNLMAALPNRDGQPWLIKNRSVAEVEGWAHEAGFRRVTTALESTDLFSVTVAQ